MPTLLCENSLVKLVGDRSSGGPAVASSPQTGDFLDTRDKRKAVLLTLKTCIHITLYINICAYICTCICTLHAAPTPTLNSGAGEQP